MSGRIASTLSGDARFQRPPAGLAHPRAADSRTAKSRPFAIQL